MEALNRVYWIAVFGTIWGVIELFGGDLMRVYDLPFKAAIITALGFLVAMVGKRQVPVVGSVVAMGVVACLYKLISNGFYSCQLLAVMMHAVAFEAGYLLLRDRIQTSMAWRALMALGIVAIGFTAFGLLNTYVIPEPHWAERGLSATGSYLYRHGILAVVFTFASISIGLWLADRSNAYKVAWRAVQRVPMAVTAATVICWILGIAFALA